VAFGVGAAIALLAALLLPWAVKGNDGKAE
jgi:hypothetical protein